MPQRHLPLFPQGVTHIALELAFMKEDGRVTYFNGHMPVFIDEENDRATFRMITSQFCVNGNAKQADIVRAFGVTSISVKRSVKLYREKASAGFYAPRPARGTRPQPRSVSPPAKRSCASVGSQNQGVALLGALRMQRDLPSLTIFSQALSARQAARRTGSGGRHRAQLGGSVLQSSGKRG